MSASKRKYRSVGAALLTFDQRRAQGLDFHFSFFKQAKPCTHHVTGRTVAAFADLALDEFREMITNDDGRVLCHWIVLEPVAYA